MFSKTKSFIVLSGEFKAAIFEPLLRQIAAEFGVNIDQVLRSPINALAEYHKS